MSITPQVYAKARAEIIALFGWNADSLLPDQTLRIDTATALRLALDDLQGRVVRGESIDVARMLTASEALARLLPPTVLAVPPAEQHGDPRQIMFEIYMKMRRNGEINLRNPDEGPLQAKIDELEAEVAALKAGSAPALLDGSSAITPREADVVPPGEIGEFYRGIRAGVDDPKPPVTIEGKTVTPAPAASAAPPSRPPEWDDTPIGRGGHGMTLADRLAAIAGATKMALSCQRFVVRPDVADWYDVLEGRQLNDKPLSRTEAYRLASSRALLAVPVVDVWSSRAGSSGFSRNNNLVSDDYDRRRRRDAADAPPRR
jgi:hypothetical protein